MRANRLERHLQPTAEITRFDLACLIPRHPKGRQESKPAQQVHAVGPQCRRRPPADHQLTEERRRRSYRRSGAINQPIRFEGIAGGLQRT